MSDEPTGWELQRTQERILEELREIRKDFSARLDKTVTADLFAAWQASNDQRYAELQKDLTEIQEDRKAEARERTKATRAAVIALITAFVAPIVVAVVLRLVLGG